MAIGTDTGGQPERVPPGLAARAQTSVRFADRIAEDTDARLLRPRLVLIAAVEGPGGDHPTRATLSSINSRRAIVRPPSA